jgi:hypothetical protein
VSEKQLVFIGENRKFRGWGAVPVLLVSSQISHGLIRKRTRASDVRKWRLTALATARPWLDTPPYNVTTFDVIPSGTLNVFTDVMAVNIHNNEVLESHSTVHWLVMFMNSAHQLLVRNEYVNFNANTLTPS